MNNVILTLQVAHSPEHAMPTESDLDLAFANEMAESPEFVAWVLSHTKFHEYAWRIRVLHKEQARARPHVDAQFWWKQWWCKIPELGTESETDIFIVFERMDTKRRFALHVENKTASGRLTEMQAESYEPRARFMMNQKGYLNHTDFTTMLIAPRMFARNNWAQCASFDCYIPYDRIAKSVPAFDDWAGAIRLVE
jgi:hypothetical protein